MEEAKHIKTTLKELMFSNTNPDTKITIITIMELNIIIIIGLMQ